MPGGQVVEDQVGAAVGDLLKQGHQGKANRILGELPKLLASQDRSPEL